MATILGGVDRVNYTPVETDSTFPPYPGATKTTKGNVPYYRTTLPKRGPVYVTRTPTNYLAFTPQTFKYAPNDINDLSKAGTEQPDNRLRQMMDRMRRMMDELMVRMGRIHTPSMPHIDYGKQEFEQLADLRAEAAKRAAREANKIIQHDISYAKLVGLAYNVTEEQKKKLINAVFSDYWDADKERRFQQLAKKYDQEGKFGWLYRIKFTKPLSEIKGVAAESELTAPQTVLTKKGTSDNTELTMSETLGTSDYLGG